MERKERAQQLRDNTDRHYNCAQAVLIPFAEELGMTAEQATAVAANFGGGMRMQATCGCLTGALMALGLLGRGEEDAKALWTRFNALEGCTDCGALLEVAAGRGLEKKSFCDPLILKTVELVEKYV